MARSVKTTSSIAKIEVEMFKRVCSVIDSPRSLACAMLIEAGDFAGYLSLATNPNHYDNTSAFADDYLVTEMLRKSKVQPSAINKREVAFEKWKAAELQCDATNEFLELILDGKGSFSDRRVSRIVARATTIIHETLGPLTKRTLSAIEEHMDFGPGVTSGLKGEITRGRKFSKRSLTTSQQLLSFGLFHLPPIWRKEIDGFVVVDHNTLAFVPKDSSTDRSITIETDLNIFVQKGIGAMLRRKLENLGVHLNHQWKVNRRLAGLALKLDLGTMDLSSASDLIAFLLVRLLFPADWFELLCWARPEFSKYVDGDKETYFQLQKFSGMGCGFTFELETLIFHALSLATCEEVKASTDNVTTFGDDIIVPVQAFDLLGLTLETLGFKVNKRKSFGKGAFRESCGADFFNGVDVRPIYFRGSDEEPIELVVFNYCNQLRRYACHRNGGYTCDSRFLPAWLRGFHHVNPRYRTIVPNFGYESSGFVGNLDEARPSWDRNVNNWKFVHYGRRSVDTQRYTLGSYIGALASKSSTQWTHGREPIRGRFKRGIVSKPGSTHNWIDLGPWV